MELRIQNQFLSVAADTLGAQLKYISGADLTEYLWRGDNYYWHDRAPVLFPYVARLTNGQYVFKGTTYSMPIHGFALQMEFIPEQISDCEMQFHLHSTDDTKKMYPFDFHFTVTYRLENNCLIQIYSVTNNGTEKMYFGIGSHHGFNIPLSPHTSFEDYYLVFDADSSPVQIGFSDDCYPNGKDKPFVLSQNKLNLNHSLFDNDAIVLSNAGKTVRLQSKNDSHNITVDFHQVPYLALWHPPKSVSPFVCIEAWCSLPSRKGTIEDLETQPSLHALSPDATYTSELRFYFS